MVLVNENANFTIFIPFITLITSFIICMQASEQNCAIETLWCVLTTRILRVLNKFCTLSKWIIQNISDITGDYWGYKVIFMHVTWRLLVWRKWKKIYSSLLICRFVRIWFWFTPWKNQNHPRINWFLYQKSFILMILNPNKRVQFITLNFNVPASRVMKGTGTDAGPTPSSLNASTRTLYWR